jgi:SAM-dependent methyltransferase
MKIIHPELFEKQVTEAWQADFSGWDFAYVSGRIVESPLPWDYCRLVREKFEPEGSLLDIGTGGGELLSSLQPLPRHTVATEAWPPNFQVARARLEPLGVQVMSHEYDGQPLPLKAGQFDLVINRHAGYTPAELYRLLKPGKYFITQQVGGANNFRLNECLQEEPKFVEAYWQLDLAVSQLREAGFKIVDQREAYPPTRFTDIGAVVYYLKVISWQVEGFTPQAYRLPLARIHNLIQETGEFVTTAHRFLISARKP